MRLHCWPCLPKDGSCLHWQPRVLLNSGSLGSKSLRAQQILCSWPLGHFIPKPKPCVCTSLSHIWFFETPWTTAHQASLSLEFSRQDYWSGWPFPPPGDLPNSGIEPTSASLQADSLLSEGERTLMKWPHCESDVGGSLVSEAESTILGQETEQKASVQTGGPAVRSQLCLLSYVLWNWPFIHWEPQSPFLKKFFLFQKIVYV